MIGFIGLVHVHRFHPIGWFDTGITGSVLIYEVEAMLGTP